MADESIVRLNYGVHFREWWAHFKRQHPEKVSALGELSASYALADYLLSEAQHFLLPPGGWLLDDRSRLYAKYAPLLHLPFPVTAFEFQTAPNAEDRGAFLCSKRIALCVDTATSHKLGLYPTEKDEWLLMSIFYADELKTWHVTPVVACISRSRTKTPTGEMIEATMKDNALLRSEHGNGYGESKVIGTNAEVLDVHFGVLPGGQKLFKDKVSSLVVMEDITDELSAGVQACAALNCQNVKTTSVEPSVSLNKKRMKADRLPLVTYHILDVESYEEHDEPQKGSGLASGRTIRQHFRRGHIRHLADDRAVWVRNCVVGSSRSGVAIKDYRILEGRSV